MNVTDGSDELAEAILLFVLANRVVRIGTLTGTSSLDPALPARLRPTPARVRVRLERLVRHGCLRHVGASRSAYAPTQALDTGFRMGRKNP